MSVGVSAKGALLNEDWGVAPRRKVEKIARLKARLLQNTCLPTALMKRASSAWSVWLFRSWDDAPGYD